MVSRREPPDSGDDFVAIAWAYRDKSAQNRLFVWISGLFEPRKFLDEFLLTIARKADRHLGLVA